MNRPLLLAISIAVLFTFGGMAGLRAGGKKKWEPAQWKVGEDQHDEITEVNVPEKRVSIHHVGGKDKVDHTLTVGAFADIKINDQKAAITDLKPGMRVIFSMTGDGLGVDRLEVIPAPKPPPTPVATATPSFPHRDK